MGLFSSASIKTFYIETILLLVNSHLIADQSRRPLQNTLNETRNPSAPDFDARQKAKVNCRWWYITPLFKISMVSQPLSLLAQKQLHRFGWLIHFEGRNSSLQKRNAMQCCINILKWKEKAEIHCDKGEKNAQKVSPNMGNHCIKCKFCLRKIQICRWQLVFCIKQETNFRCEEKKEGNNHNFSFLKQQVKWCGWFGAESTLPLTRTSPTNVIAPNTHFSSTYIFSCQEISFRSSVCVQHWTARMNSDRKPLQGGWFSNQNSLLERTKKSDEASHSTTNLTQDDSTTRSDIYANGFLPQKTTVSPEQVESGKDEPQEFTTTVSKFMDSTSAHGFYQVKQRKSFLAKLFWTSVLLLAFTGLGLHLATIVIQFLAYEHEETTSSIFGSPQFPDVTVCNMDGISADR